MKHYNILGYYLIRKHINYILRSSIVYTAKPPLWREFSSKQAKAQQSILAWRHSSIRVAATYFDLHGLSSDQWTTSWEFRLPCSDKSGEQASQCAGNALRALAQMQAVRNHTERCHASNYQRKSSVQNKGKEPIVTETDFPLLVSSSILVLLICTEK